MAKVTYSQEGESYTYIMTWEEVPLVFSINFTVDSIYIHPEPDFKEFIEFINDD